MDPSHWKLIKSRQEHLSPLAQVVSKLCLSYVLFHILKRYIFSPDSFIPAIFFVLIVISVFHRHFGSVPAKNVEIPEKPANTLAQGTNTSPSPTPSKSLQFMDSFHIPSVFTSFLPKISTSLDRQSLLNSIAGIKAYKERSMSMISRRFALFSKLSFKHREMASRVGYIDRLNLLEKKVVENYQFLHAMYEFACEFYNVTESELRFAKPISNSTVIELLNLFVRDWSSDTIESRNELFGPILRALDKEFPVSATELESLISAARSDPNSTNIATDLLPIPKTARSSLNVLVPGSGLARLAFEISRMGFQTEALEYSHLMDIAANFVFKLPEYLPKDNSNLPANAFDIYPYIHKFSHQVNKLFQTRPSRIPEFGLLDYTSTQNNKPVNGDGNKLKSAKKNKTSKAHKIPANKNQILSDHEPPLRLPNTLSLGYGDFTQLVDKPIRNINETSSSTHSRQYDAVVTLFLIDTAENVFKYIESIHTLLKPNGLWINYGPLKWGTAPQVEFCLEELESVINNLGFRIETKWEGENEYSGDPESLWSGIYKTRGWTARKV